MPFRPPQYRPPRRPGPAPSDAARGTAAERGYDYAWQKASKAFLDRHPLCTACKAAGLTVEATCVDHVIPHKGDQTLFWDESNWQALCATCHGKKTVAEDGGHFGREQP